MAIVNHPSHKVGPHCDTWFSSVASFEAVKHIMAVDPLAGVGPVQAADPEPEIVTAQRKVQRMIVMLEPAAQHLAQDDLELALRVSAAISARRQADASAELLQRWMHEDRRREYEAKAAKAGTFIPRAPRKQSAWARLFNRGQN